MHRPSVLIAFALLATITRAQTSEDLIVRTAGDTIHCTITTVREDRLYYTVLEEGHPVRSRIDMDQVALYKRAGFFPVMPGRALPKLDAAAQPKERVRVKHGWLFSASYGYSRRYAPLSDDIPQDLRSYADRLRTGRHASGSVHWRALERVAVGAMFNGFFGARNSTTITRQLADGTTIQGSVSDDIRINWYGADVLFLPMDGRKVSPYVSLGAGYVTYVNKATYFDAFTVTGNTIGANLRAGVDLDLGSGLSLGAQFGWITGRIKSFSVEEGDRTTDVDLMEPNTESLGRIDLGLVLRLRL